MENKSKFVIILLILGLMGGYYFYRKQKDAEQEMIASTYKSNHELPLITISTKNEDDASTKTRLIIGTPVVDILDNKDASERANSYIIRFISDQKEYFLKKATEDRSSTSTEQNAFSALSINPEIILVTPKVFGLKFNQSALYIHHPRADQIIRYILFDLENGKPITFDEIFPKQEVIKTIEEYNIAKNGSVASSTYSNFSGILTMNNQIMLSQKGFEFIVDSTDLVDKSISSKVEIVPLAIVDSYIDPNIKELLLSEEEYIRMSEPETAE